MSPSSNQALESLHQRTPVAEAGQLIGERFDPGRAEHRRCSLNVSDIRAITAASPSDAAIRATGLTR